MQTPGAPLHAHALEPPSLAVAASPVARSIATALPSTGAPLLDPQLTHTNTKKSAVPLPIGPGYSLAPVAC